MRPIVATDGSRLLFGGGFGLHKPRELRLLSRRGVGMDDALVRGLVELLHGQFELGLNLIGRALADKIAQLLDLSLDGLDRGSVEPAALLGLPYAFLGALGMGHDSLAGLVQAFAKK